MMNLVFGLHNEARGEAEGSGSGVEAGRVVGEEGATTEEEEREWFLLWLGGWAVMFGALVASVPLVNDQRYMLTVGLALGAAFPVAYYLRSSSISRGFVNWVIFTVAVTLGVLEVYYHWPAEGLRGYYGLTNSYRVLVKFFLWVMAFRAFALRDLEDLVLSIIPAVSCIILVMVSGPTLLSIAGTVLVVLGTLYLLSAEHVAARADGSRGVRWGIRGVIWDREPRRGTEVNTWQVVAIVVLVAAILGGGSASYMQSAGAVGSRIKEFLAREMASVLIASRIDYSPHQQIPLTGDSPPKGERVLLVVECDRSANWRQAVYAEYTGRSWRARWEGAEEADGGPRVWNLDPDYVTGFRRAGAVEVKQVFHAKAPFSRALPGLFCPVRVEVNGSVTRVFNSRTGVVMCGGYVQPGTRYEVTSLIPAEGPRPSVDALPALAEETREEYLRLPERLPERVRGLAESIAAEEHKGGDYGLALLVQTYMRENYEYDLRPPARPPGDDFVDHFLFTSQRGYCTHFASAMAVLCRCLGMPSRFVTGFVPGEYDADEETYEVRAKDAHTWVEVYIEGRGWQSFDPTPPLEQSRERGLFAGVADVFSAIRGRIALVAGSLGNQTGVVAGALVVAVICIAIVLVLRRKRQRLQAGSSGGQGGPQGQVQAAYARMLDWLGRLGLPRGKSQAPLEYAQTLSDAAAAVRRPVDAITGYYLRARYSATGVTEEDASEAEQALSALREALSNRDALGEPGS